MVVCIDTVYKLGASFLRIYKVIMAGIIDKSK